MLMLQIVPLTIRGATAVVHLTRGMHALIDAGDWELVSGRMWYAEKSRCPNLWYAATKGEHGYSSMHRFLVGQKGLDVDHRDHNGLNNRRANLRSCTRQENLANGRPRRKGSGFKGVTYRRRRGKWDAKIRVRGKEFRLGRFDSAVLAALAYDRAAKDLNGEFACTNFP